MAPRKPKAKRGKTGKPTNPSTKPIPLGALLEQATEILLRGDVEQAQVVARTVLERTGPGGDFELQALNLLSTACVRLGELDEARTLLLRAVEIDPEGALDEKVGGGPEKFLWLAQVSEEGGTDSVRWYEKGATALRSQIQALSDKKNRTSAEEEALEEKRRVLVGVLCAVTEVYMTDLCDEPDAEQRCEALVTEAIMACPQSTETWQTVANVRISQQRTEDARSALRRSLELWRDLDPADARVPEFASRIGLTRLLIEVEMIGEAMEVLERLVNENDQSVEAWYLGGWCLFLQGEKAREKEAPWRDSWRLSREWLVSCLELARQEEDEDEDEEVGKHAQELVETITKELGPMPADGEEEWEDVEDSDGDEEMS